MLHSVNGFEIPFHDDAANWGPDASARGYVVNSVPAVGSVYWTRSPQHVAWVESINVNGTVVIEDYNFGLTGQWSEHTVAASSASGYIHFKDIGPSGAGASTDSDGDGVPDGQDVAPLLPGSMNNRGFPLSSRIVSGDFNSDGYGDVATFYDYGGGETKLWISYGASGGIQAPTLIWDSGPGNWDASRTMPVVADFNGDGYADIGVLYNYGNLDTGLIEFWGYSGGLRAPVLAWDSGPGMWDWTALKAVTGDFNGDGYGDIGVLYNFGSLQTKLIVFYGGPSGVGSPVVAWDSGPGMWDWSALKPVAGDLNHDGYSDIAVFYDFGNLEVKLIVFYGQVSGFSTPTIAWDSGLGNWQWDHIQPLIGDFNGDGYTDVGVFYDYNASETKLITFWGYSGGLMAPGVTWDSGIGNWEWGRTLAVVTPIDINNDGNNDIVAFYNYDNSQTKMFTFWGYNGGVLAPGVAWDSGIGHWNWNNM
jgi:hypothetical protein